VPRKVCVHGQLCLRSLTLAQVYANAHAYHIHSLAPNSDGETYISADDLRINLWNLEVGGQSFSECFPN
jgi:hypothetical protein